MTVKIIDAGLIDQLVSVKDTIDCAREAYRVVGEAGTQVPQRSVIQTGNGNVICMPGFIGGRATACVKLVTVFDGNRNIGKPTTQSVLLLVCATTGEPLAMIDGVRLTALRTGAASAVATDLLANKFARVMALVGAGGQAMNQIDAITTVRSLEEIRLFSVGGLSAHALKEHLFHKHSNVNIKVCATAHEAVFNADIVTCITNSSKPVFDSTSISPGTHINGMGSYTAAMTEVPLTGLSNLRISVDSFEAVLLEAGDIIEPLKQQSITKNCIHEIGALLRDGNKLRQSEDDITFFKSVGIAVQDAALADLIYARYKTSIL